jgi:hypothetical protein
MVNFSTPPGLEGLFDLDRKGVDIRPTLLRVLTDQYVRSSAHSPDEQRHYTELAMRLLNETDTATCPGAARAARFPPTVVRARDLVRSPGGALHSPYSAGGPSIIQSAARWRVLAADDAVGRPPDTRSVAQAV